MNTEEKPLFAPGEMVETPMGEHQRVIQCDLHGCTVDNGTPRGARYAPEVLVRIEACLHDSGGNPNEGVTVTRRADEAERTAELMRQCGYRRVAIRG